MNQFCNKCNIEKTCTEFYFRNDIKKYRKECKKCLNEQKEKLRQKNIKKNSKIEKSNKTDLKKCSICNQTKELNKFSIYRGNKSGFYSWCLDCCKKKYKVQKKIIIKYSEIDTKKCNQCKHKKLLENFRKKHSKDGYSNICKECEQKYRKENSKNFYEKKKHKLNTNIQFKLSENIRSRIRCVLKNNKIIKPKTEKLIDSNLKKFVEHIENQFYENISFDNYGKEWHIDHIIPCNFFDLLDVNQIKACCHYTNLQPLLISHNLDKSDKLNWIHPVKKIQPTFLRLVISKYLNIPKKVNL